MPILEQAAVGATIPTTMPTTYYTIKDISEMLGISRQRVHQLIEAREIPTRTTARRIEVSEEYLPMFTEERKTGRPKKRIGRPRKTK